jgi:uncharacterized short protein YbdD (DUF466 family)
MGGLACPERSERDWQTAVTPSLCSGQAPSERSAARGPRLSLTTKLMDAIRKIAGMPDYEAYLEHFRRFHPDASLPTERQFYDEFVQARYGDGPTRCC